MLEHLNASSDAKSIRDTAIIRALYGMGLRRVELISLDLCDLDLAEARMAILGKGRLEKESISIPPRTLESLKAWVAVRGEQEGPLFISLDNRNRGHRLVGSSVYRLVAKLGKAVGLTARPHPGRPDKGCGLCLPHLACSMALHPGLRPRLQLGGARVQEGTGHLVEQPVLDRHDDRSGLNPSRQREHQVVALPGEDPSAMGQHWLQEGLWDVFQVPAA